MLQNLSNEILVERFGEWVRRERKITHHVILYIAEIQTRELYVPLAYPSIYEYLMTEFNYSRSAAARRINAARLYRQVPEIAQKLEAGTLNLSQASLLSQTIRAADKENTQSISLEQKRDVLHKIENKSFEESQKIICQELNVAPQSFDKTRSHADGSVTLTITLSAEQARRWRQVAELASHAVEAQNSAALIDDLAAKEISRRTEVKRASPSLKKVSMNPRQIRPNLRKVLITTGKAATNPTNWSSLPTKLSDRSTPIGAHPQFTLPGCTHQDPASGRVCGSRYFLQIDHIQPVWAGGSQRPENLHLLCSKHNRWKCQSEFGNKYR